MSRNTSLILAVLTAVSAFGAAPSRTIPRTVPTWADLANEDIRSMWQAIIVEEDGGIAIPLLTANLPTWAVSNWDAYKIAVSDASGSGKWVRASITDGEPVKASWFGAKNDGTTDNTASVQAALNFLVSRGGGVLEFQTGTYNFTGQVTLDSIYGKGIEIRGQKYFTGSGVQVYTRLRSSYDSGPQFYFHDSVGSSGGGLSFKNLHFVNNGSSQVGLRITNGNNHVKIKECEFHSYTAATGALWLSQTYGALIEDTTFNGCVRAFTIGGGGADWFSATYLKNVNVTACSDTTSSCVISGGTSANQVFVWAGGILQSNSAGILVDNAYYVELSGLYMEGVGLSGGYAIKLDNYRLAEIRNCFLGCTATTAACIELGDSGSAPAPVRIVNCGFVNVTDPISVTGTAQEILVEEPVEGGATTVHVVVNGGSTPLGWTERFKGETRFFDSGGTQITQIGGADGAVQGLVTASSGTALNNFSFADGYGVRLQDGSTDNPALIHLAAQGTFGNWFGEANYLFGTYLHGLHTGLVQNTTNMYPSLNISGYQTYGTFANNIGKLYIDSGGAVTTHNAPTAELQYSMTFERDTAYSLGIQRSEVVNAAGKDLTVSSSGATMLSSNKDGGTTYISGGTSTGTGTSRVVLQTAAAGASGTADNAPAAAVTVNGAGDLILNKVGTLVGRVNGNFQATITTAAPSGTVTLVPGTDGWVQVYSSCASLTKVVLDDSAAMIGVQWRVVNPDGSNTCPVYQNDGSTLIKTIGTSSWGLFGWDDDNNIYQLIGSGTL